MKEKINEMFDEIYKKCFIDKDIKEDTIHTIVNGVQIYIANYNPSENFFFVTYKGIELSKNGKLSFDNYEYFDGRSFYLETFVDFIKDKVINNSDDDCESLYFFSYAKKATKTEEKIVVDNTFKVKADILDTILNRKLTIE